MMGKSFQDKLSEMDPERAQRIKKEADEMELTIIEQQESCDYSDFMPDPKESSWVLFEVSPIADDILGRKFFFDELYWEGGAADYEHCYGGGLDYMLEELFEHDTEGFYVLEGLQISFHEDYYGEVDVEWDFEEIRPATPEEIVATWGADFWDTEKALVHTYVDIETEGGMTCGSNQV